MLLLRITDLKMIVKKGLVAKYISVGFLGMVIGMQGWFLTHGMMKV